MDIAAGISRLFAMDEATWARHAHPGSVYSRMTVLPLLIAAIWSRVWFEWPVALGLGAAVLAWTWLNPRLFPKPKSPNTKPGCAEAFAQRHIIASSRLRRALDRDHGARPLPFPRPSGGRPQ